MLSWFRLSRAGRAFRSSGVLFLALTLLWALQIAPALCANPNTDKLPPVPPDPSARLSQPSVSAAAADETALLTVETPGRFSIRAQSGGGVALQLVDMMTGPGEVSGKAGVRDGRLDVLLDRGVYRLHSLGAAGATGKAKLSVTPFRGVGAGPGDVLRGGEASGELGDLEQRSYWIIVNPGAAASVEATGRALRDLRLWRNGADRVDLKPDVAPLEPVAGHPMTRLRIDGAVEPGLYLVTAYGGAPAAWADGKAGNPFRIRVGPPQKLLGGWFEGVIDAFGSARFEIAPPATYVRLETPDVAPAQLSVARGAAEPMSAVITKTSREPIAAVTVPAKGKEPAVAEITGFEGQAFRLRALDPSSTLKVDEAGPHLIAVDVAGEGGDELPATVLLARFAKGKGTVVASKALRVARGEAWRGKFNLRGPSSLIFEIASAGPVALSTSGPGVVPMLEPLLGSNAPRADGEIPQQWDVEAGFYMLKLDPIRDAAGVIDVTFGQPGLAPQVSPAPSRATIDFGLQNIDKGAYYEIFANAGPALTLGPRARKLPADLAAAPLVLDEKAAAAVPDAPPAAPIPPKRPAAVEKPLKAVDKSLDKPVGKPVGKSGDKHADNPAPKSAANPKATAKANPEPNPKPTASPPPAPPAAQGALTIPLRAPLGGVIAAAEVNGQPVALAFSNEIVAGASRTLAATIPASDHDRRIVVSWSKTEQPAKIPAIPAPASIAALSAGEPQFFDLARDEGRDFRLDVAEGGLYRIETLGRLKTSASIGTAFIPAIDQATGNGPGHNALLQNFLRAGSYRVRVSALESEGHLGLVAHRATLIEAGALAPEQSARAALARDTGAAFAIEAPEAAAYRLDLYALGVDFPARLEDSDGWPLTPPGPMATLTQHFEKGHYRLVVPPVETDARVVARMRKIVEETPPQGHGPHPLAFDAAQAFQWREPAAADALREPDRWTFALNGPAHVTLDISEGMGADILKLGDASASIAKIAFKRGFDGLLEPGQYSVEARAIGRNDRLDYQLTLKSAEIQPGAPRLVDLPASIPFAIAADRIVSLTSFGDVELIGVLKDAAGNPVERVNGRMDDWNVALSRRLPTGTYQLDLAAAKAEGAPTGEADNSDNSQATDDSQASDNSDDAEASNDADSSDQSASDQASSDDASAPSGDAAEPDADAAADNNRGKLELHLALPETLQGPDLDLAASAEVAGPDAHTLALPAVEAGGLLVVAAQASADCVLSLERQEAGGQWRVIGADRGRAPVVAAPADGDAGRPWRVSVWPVEGAASVKLAARRVNEPDQALGAVSLKPIEGLEPPIEVAAVAQKSKSLIMLNEAPAGLRQGSTPGRELSAAAGGIIAPQSEHVWFLARGAGPATLRLDAIPSTLKTIALDLANGDVATLVQSETAPGSFRVFRAQSSFGQPGLDAAKGMGVAPAGDVSAALALDGGAPLRIFNASGGALRLSLDAFDLSAQPTAQADSHYAAAIPAGAARKVALPTSTKELEINLAPGAAAFLSDGDRAVTVWGGEKALSRRLKGAWTNVLFVNIGAETAPVSLALSPAADEQPLTAGAISKRFFGATGSSSLRVEAVPGDRLIAAGGRATFIGHDGAVLRGRSLLLRGPGELILDHDAGLTAAWVENGEKSPWPSAPPQAVAPPRTVALEGQAMTLALSPEAPILLNARSTSPVILALDQGGALGDPLLYPAGAELHAYVGAGEAKLRIYSPQDGALSGALDLTASPLIPVTEGVGEANALAPGEAALFVFDLAHAATIGVGVRADPDSATVRLLDASGNSLGEGVAQLRRLEAGRYIIEARAPVDGPALVVRPAVIGLTPPSNGPPADVAQHYLELVGLKPASAP
ncbi:hypothetical protein [Methylocella sp.]|uniref:hypothetical protein n=1 Tax=Methylocella sp. TaxID=1978226 RepID=UPI003C22715B